jgi:serine/tyrosine/threonine adenylyltransferase
MGLSHLPDNPVMLEVEQNAPLLNTGLPWRNGFHALGKDFFTPLAPDPLPEPYWVGRSDAVAKLLNLSDTLWHSDALLPALSGNQPISGTQPLASVYSGHQFGHWAGQLGDGRALLLGETNGLELQLKGSGQTPYSRMGDGRAVLRSSIREFLCSEAMHGLGIATTRCLCVVGSDEPVPRETMETAAVVTRVAPSFIRFGHFEHFAARNQLAQLKTLADYVIERYYPECLSAGELSGNVYANLLQAVARRTGLMIAQWQAVGFCHGVMNTDNMSILGLTLDYGPFQFMDAYDPGHICNHTDRGGRYAFDQQPDIANWNLFCLGHALMPLIEDQDLALQALGAFKQDFVRHWHRLMCAKLGFEVGPHTDASTHTQQTQLINDGLALLAANQVDYTLFWRNLSRWVVGDALDPVRDLFLDRPAFDAWLLLYREFLGHAHKGLAADLMLNINPKYVLRNYLGENAIKAAKSKDFSEVARLLTLLESPFEAHPGFEGYAGLPPQWASQIEISCSS